jgi:glycosyltransferase involved in cell wall biosynthesis
VIQVELTILMPCLNEAETLEVCIAKALGFMDKADIDGEVLISDNGSTDGSQEIARAAGARVVATPERGYGAALLNGIAQAQGTYVIMGDADDSYDFSRLSDFVDRLRDGADLVMGNRFAGGIMPGAMPTLHRYLGNPALSAIGRLFFAVGVKDFHCGLRGFRRESIQSLDLHSPGMEFASEMVVKASLLGLRVEEVPIVLHPDGRSRPPHLRTWRDGWRHLRFLLLYSPRWLFLYPGLLLSLVGFVMTLRLTFGPQTIGSVTLDINTLIVAVAAMVVGYQALWFAVLTKSFASREGLLPGDVRVQRLRERFPLELALVASALISAAGFIGLIAATGRWAAADWGALDLAATLRLVIPSVALIVLACQTALASLMLSILSLGDDNR